MTELLNVLQHLSPLAQFSLWMLLFLVLPSLCERANLPPVLGFLFAGLILGPEGFHLLDPADAISKLMSELGVSLLLFFVGFDIDFSLLRRARLQVMTFGLLTFLLPFTFGYAVAHALGFTTNPALLIGSLIASHTLLAYPVITRLGLTDRVSVAATAGATIFTDIASMVVLAICLLTHQSGFSEGALILQLAEIAVFVPIIVFGGSWVVKWLLHRFGNRSEPRLVLFFLFLVIATECAALFGLDGIVGAFLAGIAVRRAVTSEESAEVLKVLSHTFLIPAFFMATGMLLQPMAVLKTLGTQPLLPLGLLVALLAGKWLAAAAVGVVFRYSRAETNMVWSLSLPQVAATLAATTVAFHTLNKTGVPLIDQSVLNAVLVLVVLTSIGGPLLTQRYANRVKAAPDQPAASAVPREAEEAA